MSSYALMAKLSNIESATSDIEASLEALSTNKQNKLTNAVQPSNNATTLNILNDTTVKRLDETSPITLQEQNDVITVGLDATNIQSKLTAAGDGVNSFPLLSSDTVKGFRADFPFTTNANATTKT